MRLGDVKSCAPHAQHKFSSCSVCSQRSLNSHYNSLSTTTVTAVGLTNPALRGATHQHGKMGTVKGVSAPLRVSNSRSAEPGSPHAGMQPCPPRRRQIPHHEIPRLIVALSRTHHDTTMYRKRGMQSLSSRGACFLLHPVNSPVENEMQVCNLRYEAVLSLPWCVSPALTLQKRALDGAPLGTSFRPLCLGGAQAWQHNCARHHKASVLGSVLAGRLQSLLMRWCATHGAVICTCPGPCGPRLQKLQP